MPGTGRGGNVCPGDAHHPVQLYRKWSQQSVLKGRTGNDLERQVEDVGCYSMGDGVAMGASQTGEEEDWICINISAYSPGSIRGQEKVFLSTRDLGSSPLPSVACWGRASCVPEDCPPGMFTVATPGLYTQAWGWMLGPGPGWGKKPACITEEGTPLGAGPAATQTQGEHLLICCTSGFLPALA